MHQNSKLKVLVKLNKKEALLLLLVLDCDPESSI